MIWLYDQMKCRQCKYMNDIELKINIYIYLRESHFTKAPDLVAP